MAQSKDKHDPRNLSKIAKEATGKKPMTLITDGHPAYHDAYKKEFWTLKDPRTEHVQHITLRGDHNNNKMERMNGEVRDREKVLKGLKKEDSAMLKVINYSATTSDRMKAYAERLQRKHVA